MGKKRLISHNNRKHRSLSLKDLHVYVQESETVSLNEVA